MGSDFLLHHDVVTAPGTTPDRYMLVLHGILGSGSNWRTFARRLVVACPSWGLVLVDLRAHGLSTAAPPPHSLAAAAADLLRLQTKLDRPVKGVLGHSFGGKVALSLADMNPTPLEQVWVLDSQPGARHEELSSERTAAVMRMLEEMPAVFESREEFLETVEDQGHNRTFAAWLAMNLRRAEEGTFRLRIDMAAIRRLFESYYETDLWHVVERHDKARDLFFVIGGKSEVVGPDDRARLAEIEARAPHLKVHTLPDAGHWVHVDDPEGLFAIVSAGVCGAAASE